MKVSSVILLLVAVFSIQLIGCASSSSSDNEPTKFLPSKYVSRRIFTEATTVNTTLATDSAEPTTGTTTMATTTPKARKFTYGKSKRVKGATTTTSAPESTNTTTTTTPETTSPMLTTSPSTTVLQPESTTPLPTTKAPKLNCGTVDPESDLHPWIVILEHTDGMNTSRRRTFSKGVLISDQYVLTTVSSIHNSHPFWEVSRIRLGDFPVGLYNKLSSYKPVFADVEEVILHPKRDIALVKMTKTVNFTELIQPICLPTSENYNFREMILHSCRKIKNRIPARVHVESMSVLPVSPQDCSTLFHRKGANFSSREEFCSWDERVDTCTGDLGAPLIGLENGQYQVVGLASYATSKRPIRDPALPGIYTRVGKHTKWIKKVLAENL